MMIVVGSVLLVVALLDSSDSSGILPKKRPEKKNRLSGQLRILSSIGLDSLSTTAALLVAMLVDKSPSQREAGFELINWVMKMENEISLAKIRMEKGAYYEDLYGMERIERKRKNRIG